MTEDRFHYPTCDSFMLDGEQAHIWRASLIQPQWQVERLAMLLGEEERAQAERFLLRQDRERFIVARGLRRDILAGYLKIPPRQLRFACHNHGKPFLQDFAIKLQFNVSHSGTVALFAVTYDRQVGIDLEAIRTDFEVESIARQYFTGQDIEMICRAPVDQQHRIFFNCWALQEAYWKACGAGLSAARQAHANAFAANSCSTSRATAQKLDSTSRWWSHRLTSLPGYAAALVTEGRCQEVRCWQWFDRSGD